MAKNDMLATEKTISKSIKVYQHSVFWYFQSFFFEGENGRPEIVHRDCFHTDLAFD